MPLSHTLLWIGLADHDRSRSIVKRSTPRSIRGVCAPIDRRLIVDRSRSTISKRERRNFHRIIARRRGERKTSPSPPRSLSRDGISVTRKGGRRTSPSSSPYLSRSRAQAGGVLRHPHLAAFSSPPLPRFHSLSFSPPSINDRSRRNSPSTRGFSSPGSQFGNITKKTVFTSALFMFSLKLCRTEAHRQCANCRVSRRRWISSDGEASDEELPREQESARECERAKERERAREREWESEFNLSELKLDHGDFIDRSSIDHKIKFSLIADRSIDVRRSDRRLDQNWPTLSMNMIAGV